MKSKKKYKNKKRKKYAGSQKKNEQPLLTHEEIEEVMGENFNKLSRDQQKLKMKALEKLIHAIKRERAQELSNEWNFVNQENAPVTHPNVANTFIKIQKAFTKTNPEFKKQMRNKYHINNHRWVGSKNLNTNPSSLLMNEILEDSKKANKSITQQRKFGSKLNQRPIKAHFIEAAKKLFYK